MPSTRPARATTATRPDPARRGLRCRERSSAAAAAATTTSASASRTTRATSSPIRTAACSSTASARPRHRRARLAVRLRARSWSPRAATTRRSPTTPISCSPAARCSRADQRHAVLQHGHVPVHRGSAPGPRRPPHAARLSPGPLRRLGDDARQRRGPLDVRPPDRWHQKLAFIAVPFFDAGRPYDSLGELTLSGLAAVVRRRAAHLVEPRDDRRRSTTASVAEDTGLYINFNHIF